MGYQGIEMTSQEDYIFEGTAPYNPEFDLEELKIIENKLIDYTSGDSINGLTPQEAEVFLDWITFNVRNYAVRNVPESAMTSSMTGQCAPTQRVNVKLLKKLGLDARAFNTGDCIKEAGGIEEDNFWGSKAVRHSVSLVNIPIVDNYGNTAEYKYLLDPTFRQFCLQENCNGRKFSDAEWLGKGYVAPHPGYFMQENNLRQFGASQEVAQKTEALGRYIVSKGYFYLNEENAKLYGDVFVRSSRRLDAQNIPIYMSGEKYIFNFENIPMKLLESDKEDIKYTKLPSEIEEQKQGLFTRIKNFFKERFGNKQKMLQSGSGIDKIEIPNKPKLESAVLTEEQELQFREGETQVLNSYYENENQYQYNSQTNIKEESERY